MKKENKRIYLYLALIIVIAITIYVTYRLMNL